jgi:phosphohistidine phosphatase
MGVTLILMRHAKSSWEDPTLEDFDRPLNTRGRRSAEALGRWLRDRGHRPAGVLTSPARRTRETLERLRPFLPPDLPRRDDPRLYDAEADTMLEVLRGGPRLTPLLMLGHNPGIGEFAELLVARPPAHPAFHRYPTGATLVARFPAADWADLAPGSGEVVDFVVPRDLLG